MSELRRDPEHAPYPAAYGEKFKCVRCGREWFKLDSVPHCDGYKEMSEQVSDEQLNYLANLPTWVDAHRGYVMDIAKELLARRRADRNVIDGWKEACAVDQHDSAAWDFELPKTLMDALDDLMP